MMKKTNEDGYMLVTTLLLLILSGLFLQATIHIYSNQIIQFKQFSSAYEYKAALNIAETVLKEIIEDEKEGQPVEGTIETSLGSVKIEKITEDSNRLTIYTQEGGVYSKNIRYNIEDEEKDEEAEQEELEESEVQEKAQESIIDNTLDPHGLGKDEKKLENKSMEMEEAENIKEQEERVDENTDVEEPTN